MKNIYLALVLIFILNNGFSQSCYPTFSMPTNEIYYVNFNSLLSYSSQVTATGVKVYPKSPSFPHFTTKLSIGLSYRLAVLPYNGSGSGEKYGVWIDYNNDSIFSSNENVYTSSQVYHGIDVQIAIPYDTTIIGDRKVRIVCVTGNSTLDACGNYYHGECEEYTIEFTADTILPVYCVPVCINGVASASIKSFSINTLHNCNSGQPDPYSHYPISIHTTTLEMGKSYNMFISDDNYNGAGTSIAVRAFLDYNDDHVFSSNETILTTNDHISNGVVNIAFDSSFVGKRRLRIYSRKSGVAPNACYSFTHGEVEDYDITIAFPSQDTSVSIPNRVEKIYVKSGKQYAKKIIETYDKGFLLSGALGDYGSYIHTLKTTIDGNILSEKRYNWTNYYFASGLDKTFNGGYVFSGITTAGSNDGGIGFIKKITPCGNLKWEKKYGDPDKYGYLREVYQTSDSGFIATGSYLLPNSSKSTDNVCVLKTDKLGNTLWLNDYTTYSSSSINSFIKTEQNGALLSLRAYSPNIINPDGSNWRRGVLTKIDSSGNLEWNLLLDTNDIISNAMSSVELYDNGFLTAGFVSSEFTDEIKFALFKTSKNGALLNYKIFENTDYYYHIPKVIKKINDNKFMVLCNDISECDKYEKFPFASVYLIDSSLNIINYRQIDTICIKAEDAIITSNNKIMLTGTTMKKNYKNIYTAKLNIDDLSMDSLYNSNLNYDSLCDPSESINQLMANKYNVTFSPNPTANNVRVEVGDYNYQKYNIEMFSYNGRLVKSLKNINQESININLDKFPSGLILIRIIFEDGAVNTKKIIKI